MSDYTHDILKTHGKDFKFPVNFGDGMIFDYEYDWGTKTANPEHIKVRLKVKAPERKGPREATLHITSFAGTSFGAIGVEQGMDSALTDWEHVSVSLPNRCPTWEEMCFVKDLFFTKDEVCVQFHPREADYVNNHPFCLHIWRHKTAVFPTPPDILVGVKSRGLITK